MPRLSVWSEDLNKRNVDIRICQSMAFSEISWAILLIIVRFNHMHYSYRVEVCFCDCSPSVLYTVQTYACASRMKMT